jgi:hypothetical protein
VNNVVAIDKKKLLHQGNGMVGYHFLDILTPKIPCVLLPNFAIFDIVGKINFSNNKSMRI